MAWQKGQTGNPSGRGAPKPWKDALARALKRAEEGNALEKIADICVQQALDGDKDSRREIAERIDGKVPQAIIGADDEPPVNIHSKMEITIVDPEERSEGVQATAEPGSL